MLKVRCSTLSQLCGVLTIPRIHSVCLGSRILTSMYQVLLLGFGGFHQDLLTDMGKTASSVSSTYEKCRALDVPCRTIRCSNIPTL